jgi:hypothetical protein
VEETSVIKVCESCRRIRLCVVFLFVVSAVLAGVFWSQVGQSTDRSTLLFAIGFTALSIVLILGVEIVVTRVEIEAKRLYLQLKEKAEEISILKGKIAELDRTVDLLAQDNENLRRDVLDESFHHGPAESSNT